MEYKILSPDFNDQMQWEDFGILELNINDGSFIHRNNELWLKNKIYPINLFALIENEREKIIKEKYVGYGSLMWAMSIHNFTKECFLRKVFPDEKRLIG